jgi:hypothetical protein
MVSEVAAVGVPVAALACGRTAGSVPNSIRNNRAKAKKLFDPFFNMLWGFVYYYISIIP